MVEQESLQWYHDGLWVEAQDADDKRSDKIARTYGIATTARCMVKKFTIRNFVVILQKCRLKSIKYRENIYEIFVSRNWVSILISKSKPEIENHIY
jgi:hypothetical protein